MAEFTLPPTHNPCPWCDVAPCVDCRDARGSSMGVMPDGTMCPQGYAIWQRRLKGEVARRFVESPEFAIAARFLEASMADLTHADPAHPQRAWQAACAWDLTEWCRDVSYQKKGRILNVVIKGVTSGVGKTYVAAAMVNHLRDSGITAVLVEIKNLLWMINRAQFRKEEDAGGHMTVDDILKVVKGCEVLVLDDLKAAAITEYQRETVWDIVNWRYQNLKSIVLTTQAEGKSLSPSSDWYRIIRRIAEPGDCLTVNIDEQKTVKPENVRRDISE